MSQPSTAEIYATIRTFIHDGNPALDRAKALTHMLNWRAEAKAARDPTYEALFHYAARDSRDLDLILTIAEAPDDVLFAAAVEHYQNHEVSLDLLTPSLMCSAIRRIAAAPHGESTWTARELASKLRIAWLHAAGPEIQWACVEALLADPRGRAWLVSAFMTEAAKIAPATVLLGGAAAIDLISQLDHGRDMAPAIPVRLAAACIEGVSDLDLPAVLRTAAKSATTQPGLLAEICDNAMRTGRRAAWEAATQAQLEIAKDDARLPSERIQAARYAIIAAQRARFDDTGPRSGQPASAWPWEAILDQIEPLNDTPPFGRSIWVDLRKAGRLRSPAELASEERRARP